MGATKLLNDRHQIDQLASGGHLVPATSAAGEPQCLEVRPDDFTIVVSKRGIPARRYVNLGTAERGRGEDNTSFRGRDISDKKAWFFVSRIRDEVAKDVIETYISKRLGVSGDDIVVKEMETVYDRKDSKCFQVGVK